MYACSLRALLLQLLPLSEAAPAAAAATVIG